jgi:RNA polymerase sigma-70 factor, ECF subfamily
MTGLFCCYLCRTRQFESDIAGWGGYNYVMHVAAPVSLDFQALTDPYQRELLVHSYRFLGSLDDAEDAVQEALLRAWRGLDTLREQAALRPWLYRIVTNVSLDMLASRKVRSLPPFESEAADPLAPLPAPETDPRWLEPLPDEYLAGQSPNPEARYELHESVSLAFLAVLQRLPGRQRAALILRDVLGWKAQEVAELLEMSVAAVNSALQRARSTLQELRVGPGSARPANPPDAATTAMLNRYMQAWEAGDVERLVALLRDDAILTMPPLPAWYGGRAAIRLFFERHLFSGASQNRFRMALTRANGCPAMAVYQAGADGVYQPASLQVLAVAEGAIVRADCFLVEGEKLFARFKLPLTL